MVLSAWCLGILNSHEEFFLSYVSPVIWNIAQIAALIYFGRRADLPRLAMYTAWASVVGSGLQFLVQLPVVLSLVPALKLLFSSLSQNVRIIITNFFPIFISRGITQLSAFVDTWLASFLGQGAVAALSNAQTLYLLPVSLFGLAISAAELPSMSSATGSDQEIAETLRKRIQSSTKRIAFFVVPSAVAFLALGDVVIGSHLSVGQVRSCAMTNYVWGILAGSAVGLVAATVGRLYSSAFYALRDTRLLLRYAIIRVILTTGVGIFQRVASAALLGIVPVGAWQVDGLLRCFRVD